MIAVTAYQFTILMSALAFIVWLIRLEGRLSQEISLRAQYQQFLAEKDTAHQNRVLSVEGRILDELRKLEATVRRMDEKLDHKQDKGA